MGRPICPDAELLTDTQSSDNRTVSLDVYLDQVVQQRAALTDHLKEAATRVMILFVDLQVLGKVVDPLGQQSNLHLGRACVALVCGILLHDRDLFFFQHVFHPFFIYCVPHSTGPVKSSQRLNP